MRFRRLVLTVAVVAGVASPAMGQNGILLVTDKQAWAEDFRACMMNARNTLLGAGMVIQPLSASVIASNEDRTISIRCDIPGHAVFDEAFFPGEPDRLDTVTTAFAARRAATLIPAEAKAHQYTVDCYRPNNCRIDPAAICRQAYVTSAKPAAAVLKETGCVDTQGSYTCQVVYDLNCN